MEAAIRRTVIFAERLGMRIVEVEILFIDVQTPRCNEAFEISFSALQSDDLGRNALSLEVVRDRCREQRLAVFVSSEDTGEQPKVKASVQHRSEERRVGKEGVRTVRCRGARYH